MRYTTVLALGLAAFGLAATASAASAMPATPESTIAIPADEAGVTAAHYTGWAHSHWSPRPRPYYRPYRPYRPYYHPRPYYQPRPYYGWGHRW